MSDLPAEEVELIEDPEEVHKIYKQSFIDEQVKASGENCEFGTDQSVVYRAATLLPRYAKVWKQEIQLTSLHRILSS